MRIPLVAKEDTRAKKHPGTRGVGTAVRACVRACVRVCKETDSTPPNMHQWHSGAFFAVAVRSL
eukprot:2562228-Amphidinium_carterae.1